MRQAGRYLPEYLNTKKTAGSFVNLCLNPDLATEVTLQPIKRFGLDAAIIFSDILMIPYGLGCNLDFFPGRGPVLSNTKLVCNKDQFSKKLDEVYLAVRKTRSDLRKDKPLIGFAGAPFTLLAYFLAKEKVGDKIDEVRGTILASRKRAQEIIKVFEEYVIFHLQNQINAGADIVKIFDSWAGILPEGELYEELVISPTKNIVDYLRAKNKTIQIMAFPRNSGEKYIKFVNEVKPDILTIDYNVDLNWAESELSEKVVLQGNFNPSDLFAGKSEIAKKAKKIINILGRKKFIFNLGHGILPKTPIENVEYLISTIRNG